MSIIPAARAKLGYSLSHEEGEVFWLLGMLQTIKVGRDPLNGALDHRFAQAGENPPWTCSVRGDSMVHTAQREGDRHVR